MAAPHQHSQLPHSLSSRKLQSTSRVTLEDWDRLAPLSELAKASVTAVQDSLQDRPFPAHLAGKPDRILPSRPDTPIRKAASRYDLMSASSSNANDSPRLSSSLAALPRNNDPLELIEPVHTTQQFYDWYARVENAMEREQEESYRACLAEVEAYVGACDEVLEQLEDARGLIHEMDANYRFVEENSRALQVACETLLEEQKHLLHVSTAISSRLDYFRELDSATRMLNLPGEDIVLRPDFITLIARLDECLRFLRANRDFKDSEIYLIRFQQCLTRSMTLIKMFFVRTITALGQEVAEKSVGKELGETAQETLFYAKFSSIGARLQPLVYELESRARSDVNEYGSLMVECYTAWFAVRNQLLAGPLAEEVRRMDPQNSELIKLARAGCNHLRGICLSEWNLFKEVFSSAGEDQIYRYLETLCDHLYDSLRPRILHEPKLEILCELCTVLQALMALDADDGDDSDEEDDTVAIDRPISRGQGTLGSLKFASLLETVLQDAQTRLVFRAQAVVQSDVLRYSPTTEDLDYPEKLKGSKRLSTLFPTKTEASDGETSLSGGSSLMFELPSAQAQETWYPTLRKTLWVLSKLHTFVKSTIFEDFAGEAVTLCRQSLSIAAAQLSKRPTTSSLDGQLFLIRHLLILKEMVRSFDLVQIDRAVAFGSVSDMLTGLLRNSSALFNPNALFELAAKGVTHLAETTMTDAKTDLDAALKTVCEDLIAQSALSVTLPLRTWLGRVASFLSAPAPPSSSLSANGGEQGVLAKQEWAKPEEVRRLHDAFVNEGGGLEKGVQEVVGKLATWLSDRPTISVLVPPMQDEIADTYTSFYNLVRAEYDADISGGLLAPAAIRDRLRALAGALSGTVKAS